MNTFRKAYSVFGALLMVEFFAQFYFMAAAIFTIISLPGKTTLDNAGNNSSASFFSGSHGLNGLIIIPITILILIGLSFGARYPARTKWLTAALFGLMVVQFLLAGAGFSGLAWLAGLHGLNALVLVSLGAYLAVKNWAFGSRGAAAQTASQKTPAI